MSERGPTGVRYDERLAPPPLVWLAALLVSLLVAASLHGGAPGLRGVLPYVVLPLLTLAVLALLSRGRVRVEDGVLHVPGGRIGLEHLGGATPLDREDTRRVRGPLAQQRAFVSTRAWLATAVRVQVEDPQDDTPYWLVGTRRPEQLASVLRGPERSRRPDHASGS